MGSTVTSVGVLSVECVGVWGGLCRVGDLGRGVLGYLCHLRDDRLAVGGRFGVVVGGLLLLLEV